MQLRFSQPPPADQPHAIPNGCYLPEFGHEALTRAQKQEVSNLLIPGIKIRYAWHLPENGIDDRSPTRVWNGVVVDASTIQVDPGCAGADPRGGLYAFPPDNVNNVVVEVEWIALFRRPAAELVLAPAKRPREIDEHFVQAMELVMERTSGEDTGPRKVLVEGLRVPVNPNKLFSWAYAYDYFGKASTWRDEVDAFRQRKAVEFTDPRYRAEWYAHCDCVASYLSSLPDASHLTSKDKYYHVMYLSSRLIALAVLGTAKLKAGEAYDKAKTSFEEDWGKQNGTINYEKYFRNLSK